jgi:hypothetical protein
VEVGFGLGLGGAVGPAVPCGLLGEVPPEGLEAVQAEHPEPHDGLGDLGERGTEAVEGLGDRVRGWWDPRVVAGGSVVLGAFGVLHVPNVTVG